MAVSYGAQCISSLIISYVLHIKMYFDNCCKSHGGAVHPNFLFLMLFHQMCGNWPTPCGIHSLQASDNSLVKTVLVSDLFLLSPVLKRWHCILF